MGTGEGMSTSSNFISEAERHALYDRERKDEEICRANKVERGFDTTPWSIILERLSNEGKLYLQPKISLNSDEILSDSTNAQEIFPAANNLHTQQPEA